jgi:hypothetical protein
MWVQSILLSCNADKGRLMVYSQLIECVCLGDMPGIGRTCCEFTRDRRRGCEQCGTRPWITSYAEQT